MTDVLIVGSGAGGSSAAFRLCELGFDVTLLEKGAPLQPMGGPPGADTYENELGEIQWEQRRPSAENDPTVIISQGKELASATRVGQAFYLVGGGTTRYTATSWRLRPKDLLKRTTYGAVAGTTLVDWPISYAELERYYTQAELEIGVSGRAGVDPTEPHRSRDVLLPPLHEDLFQKRLTRAALGLGWKPFPIPVAIHSQGSARTGASPCMQCGFCSGYPCQFRAKSSVDLVLLPRALRTGKLQVVHHAYVTQILTAPNGRASGVEYLDLSSGGPRPPLKKLDCQVLVLAASAIQSTRLLLLSGRGRGLANGSGELGKNLMFHIEAKAQALFDEDYHQAYYKKVGIHDFYFPKAGASFVNHCSLQSGSKAGPIGFALSQPGFGREAMRKLRAGFLRTQELQVMAEDLPQATNLVRLSTERKDAWGLPAAEVHHRYHAQDRAAVLATLARARELLQAAGGQDIRLPEAAPETILSRYTWHLMGTARMGRDASDSVTDAYGRTFDVPNLFICDGSTFPTSGGLNPTLTIQALAFRAADRIATLRKEGTL